MVINNSVLFCVIKSVSHTDFVSGHVVMLLLPTDYQILCRYFLVLANNANGDSSCVSFPALTSDLRSK